MGVHSAKDFFRVVSLLEQLTGSKPSFSIEVLAQHSQEIRCAGNSVLIPDASINCITRYDLVIIPPMEGPALTARQWRSKVLIDWLAAQLTHDTPVLAMTTSAGLLAATGLMADTLMCTHWAYVKHLSREFPDCTFTTHSTFLHINTIYTTSTLNGCFDALLDYISTIKGDHFTQLCATHLLVSDPLKLTPVLPGSRNHTDEAIMRIQDALETHFSANMPITSLAGTFGFSERNLKRRFKEATGLSINQYQQHVRLDKAKKLLMVGNFSVKQAAFEVGYENVSFFIRLFKREVGVTPSEWRKGQVTK